MIRLHTRVVGPPPKTRAVDEDGEPLVRHFGRKGAGQDPDAEVVRLGHTRPTEVRLFGRGRSPVRR